MVATSGPNTVVTLVTISALLAVLVWFDVICLRDLARAREVRYLTRQAWALLILITMPVGGVLYLMYGKVR